MFKSIFSFMNISTRCPSPSDFNTVERSSLSLKGDFVNGVDSLSGLDALYGGDGSNITNDSFMLDQPICFLCICRVKQNLILVTKSQY